MKLGVSIVGSLVDIISIEIKAQSDGMRRAVTNAGKAVQLLLRDQTRAAGFAGNGGTKLANAWRLKVYPNEGTQTLRPSAMVYTQAPRIIEAFDKGAIIRGKGGGWLAIPSPEVRRMSWARSSARTGEQGITPGRFERQTGLKLRFVYSKKRVAFLVTDGVRAINGRGFRASTSRRLASGRKQESLIAFVLVKQVGLRKRLDIEAVRRQADAILAASIAREVGAA